jgi:hypothetical protein
MILADAFRRVLRFWPRPRKDRPSLLDAVRLEPARAGRKARVYAVSGALGIAVDVDGEAPLLDVVLDASVLRSALKGKSQIAVLAELPGGIVSLDVETKKNAPLVNYKIPGGSISTFPFFPDPPENAVFTGLPGFELLRDSVLHHAHGDGSRPELSVVAFDPSYAEATDLERYARLALPWGLTGHVPIEVFGHWPDDEDVTAASAPPYLYFRTGDELRFSALREPARYHEKMAAYLQAELPGAVVLAAKDLRDLAERSQKISPWGIIVLELSPLGCVGRSYAPWIQQEGTSTCEAVIKAPHVVESGLPDPVQITVAAPHLATAVAATPTPSVLLRYKDAVSPLRLEMGALTICLWPSPWTTNQG